MKTYSIGVFLDIFTQDRSNWENQVQFINGLGGVEHIEILLEYIPQKQTDTAFFKHLGKVYTLIVHSASLDLTFISPHRDIVLASRAKVRQAYEFAQKIGAHVFTLHAGLMSKFQEEDTVAKELKREIALLKPLISLPVCVENMSENWSIQIPYPSTADHFRHVAEFSDVTLDIGHFLKSGVDPIPILKELSSRIKNIHLHDGQPGKAHQPLETGELNLPRLLKVLDEVKYCGFLTLELVGRKNIQSSWEQLRKALDE